MTTNQTIDGVPREDLEMVLIHGHSTTESNEAWDRLRALLEAESVACAQSQAEGKRERFQKWVMATKHPVYGFLDGRSLARGDDRTGYADEYVQGLWVAYLAFGAEQPAPVAPQKYDDTLLPFVELMRKELHANAGKGDRPGWLSMSSDTCLLEIIYHFGKLQASVKRGDGDGMAEYGADVANLCMMLLDICGVINLVQHAEQPVPVAVAPSCCGSCPGGCVYGLKA